MCRVCHVCDSPKSRVRRGCVMSHIVSIAAQPAHSTHTYREDFDPILRPVVTSRVEWCTLGFV